MVNQKKNGTNIQINLQIWKSQESAPASPNMAPQLSVCEWEKDIMKFMI